MFKKLKLSAKIAALSAVLFIFMSIVGIIAVINMFNASKDSRHVAHQILPAIKYTADILDDKGNLRMAMRKFTYTSEPADGKDVRNEMNELVMKADEVKKFIKEEVTDLPAFVRAYEQIDLQIKPMSDLYDTIIETGIRQFNVKSQFGDVGSALTDEIMDLRREMNRQRDAGRNTSAANDRDNMTEMVTDFLTTRILINRFIQVIDTTGGQEIIGNFQKLKEFLNKNLIESKTVSEDFRQRLKQIDKEHDAYLSLLQEFMKISTLRSNLYDKQQDMIAKFSSDVEDLVETTVSVNTQRAVAAAVSLTSGSIMMIAMLAVAMVLGIIMSIFIINSIVRPITTAIDELSAGSRQITGASGEISGAAQSMSSGASEQASSLEEISASLNEITSMTRQTAENAKNADALVKDSVGKSKESKNAMQRLLSAVNEIKQSSDETANILKDIDEIAFQTNLLALNAAVEAARAGEAGKGFAVVAEEVRNLAQRSAAAAKKTAELIQASQKNSVNGVTLAEETAASIDKIAEASDKIEILVDEISKAADEQSRGVSQVNSAIGNLDQVTQTNASQSEELAASSEELSSQALSINDLVGDLVTVVAGEVARAAREHSRGGTGVRRRYVTGTIGSIRGSRSNSGRYRAITRNIPVKSEKMIPFHDDKGKDYGNY